MSASEAREVDPEPPRWPRVGLAVLGGLGLVALGVAAYAFARPSTHRFNGPIITYRDGRKCAVDAWGFTYDAPLVYPGEGVQPLGPNAGTFSDPVVIDMAPHAARPPPRDLPKELHLYGPAFGMPGEGSIPGDAIREIRFFGEELGTRFEIASIEIDFTDRPMLVVERKPDEWRMLFGGTGAHRRSRIHLVAHSNSPDCAPAVRVDLTDHYGQTNGVPIRVELRR